MKNEYDIQKLWNECKDIFLIAKNYKLDELLEDILIIVKEHYEIFCEVADLEFLDYIVQINAKDFEIGKNGDDFELGLKEYCGQTNVSLDDIWRIVSQLTWDLIIPVTEKICPFCRCDYLVLLTDKNKEHIYEFCENCFGVLENGIQIKKPNNLVPASKDIVKSWWKR